MALGQKSGNTGSSSGNGRSSFGSNALKKKKPHANPRKLLQKPGSVSYKFNR